MDDMFLSPEEEYAEIISDLDKIRNEFASGNKIGKHYITINKQLLRLAIFLENAKEQNESEMISHFDELSNDYLHLLAVVRIEREMP